MDDVAKRGAILFLFKSGKLPKEIHNEMSQTLGHEAPSYSTVKKWIKNFKCGDLSIQNHAIPGRPADRITDELIRIIKAKIDENRRFTVRALVDELGIPKTTIHRILSEYLGLKKICARWIPRILSGDQRQKRVESSQRNLDLFQRDPEKFLSRIVTMDESWIHHYDPESKVQSKEWLRTGDPPPLKARRVLSAKKIMLSVFVDREGPVLTEYFPTGDTITGIKYADQLIRLREAIIEKRRGKLKRRILFHQDNAPAHRARCTMAMLDTLGFEIMDHPPYSPDLAYCDFYLFPKLKSDLRG